MPKQEKTRAIPVAEAAGEDLREMLRNSIMVEPVTITAGTVAMWLAQGAVQYLGGKAMASIMGDPSVRDVKRWIAAAVDEIKAFLAAELQRQIVQQYVDETFDKVDGMRRDLLDYGASKDIQLLYQQFGSNMNAWISATARLGLPVVMVYANAVSLRMMVLAGFIKDHRLKNFIPRLEETVDEAEWHISGCITEHLRWLDAGVASVGEITWVHQKKFNPQYAGGFSHRNGTEGYQSNDRQEMLQVLAKMRLSRIRAYEQERAVAIESFHMPLLKSVELWKDAARKVGGSKAGIASKR